MLRNLKLHWLATFTDGGQIKQFDGKKENSFRQVLDRQNDLRYFTLYHTEKDLKFSVDLELGIIYINKQQIPEKELLIYLKTKNKRLVYFRRIAKEIGTVNGKTLNTKIIYFLGFQYNDKMGKNFKKIIQINDEGNLIV